MQSGRDSTERFSDRVENYAKYRPDYPADLIQFLYSNGIDRNSTVCDIGAGTGILSQLLIDHVGSLYAVEPNRDMRSMADQLLGEYNNYKSFQNTAEDTRLDESSIDAITVAQAFHWFDIEKCRKEFKRILKPGGHIFLIWNKRINSTPFMEAYNQLLHRYGTDYKTVNHQNLTDEDLRNFINLNFKKTVFDNFQEFDQEGFLGRVFSSSYTPAPDHPDYLLFLSELKRIFREYQKNGIVRFSYRTEVFSGNLL